MADVTAQRIFSIPGRTAVITGAGNGLGRMIAKGFVANGATVISLVDRDMAGLEQTKGELERICQELSLAAHINLIPGDLSTESGIQAIVGKLLPLHSMSLDILVHCAGIRLITKVEYNLGNSLSKLGESMRALPYTDMEASFKTNLFSQYYLTAGLIEKLGEAARLGEGRGSVICFSSVAAQHFGQFAPAYQLSKAAIDHMVITMAAEFAEFYVRVNAISPGLFPSNMNPRDPSHPNYNNMAHEKEMPARRAGTEQEMIGTALYLASPAGAYMTGENLRVDGGRLLVLSGRISDPS